MSTYPPWISLRTIWVGAAAGVISMSSTSARAAAKFQDPLDTPAQMRTAPATRPLLGIARAGAALVAVGSRGMIVRSEDEGRSWTQAAVPVQSDLLAVQFPTARDGWAVGHDGIILHSGDGGISWTKQLDGRIAADTFKKFYAAQQTDTAAKAAAEVERNLKAGPVLPWLDVWFEDAQRGFVVGSFGMIAATADGGKTWTPWLERIDDDRGLNLNAVRGVGDAIYVAAERGMIFKLDRGTGRFKASATGYVGSFFGIMGSSDALLAFGLRGVVYRSGDAGKSWELLKMPVQAAVTAGAVSDSGFVLVNSAGQFLRGDRRARSFTVAKAGQPMRCTGIVLAAQETAVVTGLAGVRTESLSGNAN